MDNVASPFITIKQAAELLQLGDGTVYKLLNSGKLKGKKIGGQWRIHKPSLEQKFLESEPSAEVQQ